MNPMTSGGLAFSGAVAAKGVLYVFGLAHLPAPDPDVAELIAALIIGGGHAAISFVKTRFPAKA